MNLSLTVQIISMLWKRLLIGDNAGYVIIGIAAPRQVTALLFVLQCDLLSFQFKQLFGYGFILDGEKKLLGRNGGVARAGNAAHDEFAFVGLEQATFLREFLQGACAVAFAVSIDVIPVKHKGNDQHDNNACPDQYFFHLFHNQTIYWTNLSIIL